MRRWWIAAMVVLAVSRGAAIAQTLEAQMQALLDSYQATYGFPGATAAIAHSDGDVVSVATGLADLQAETPMAPGTRMLAASIGGF